MKLLNGEPSKGLDKTEKKLACLSRRLPIDFYSTTSTSRQAEEEQVEGHMRVCLNIDHDFEGMTTVSPSEPLLSEAAARLTHSSQQASPMLLSSVLHGFSIDKGDRGEFICMQLLNDARDTAVYGRPDVALIPLDISLVFSVADFFGNLFRRKLTGDLPSKVHPSHEGTVFGTLFANAKMNFNHFVKVHEFAAIKSKFLVGVVARAAAILCANNHKGIDGLVPFTYYDTRLQRMNIGVFIWQSKNDPSYTSTPQHHLFDAMNPFELGVISAPNPNDPPIPIIRVVFALAAKTNPSLTLVRYEDSSSNFTTFDYWCSGISSEVLTPVESRYQATWDDLLQASYPWKQVYTKALNPVSRELRRAANPLAATDLGHYDTWFEFKEEGDVA